MSRIAYIAVIGDPNSGAAKGVHDKVSAQLNALATNGHDAIGFFGLTAPLRQPISSQIASHFFLAMPNSRVFRKGSFLTRVIEHLEGFKPDIVYIRYPLAGPSLNTFLKRLRRKFPDVVIAFERQTKELPELLMGSFPANLAKYALEYAYRNAVQKHVNFNIGVTQEICHYIESYCTTARCIVCGNGIPSVLAKMPLPERMVDGNLIKLVFVGNITPWSGLELIIESLSELNFEYHGKTIHLDIIGEGVSLKKLMSHLDGAQSQITFHGFLSGEVLAERVRSADLALGALNNSMRGLHEGSNLKLRLYCSLGVPFVLGEIDTDFTENPEADGFYCKVSPSEGIDHSFMTTILDFAIRSCTEEDLRDRMNSFAMRRLSWESKMQYIVEEISQAR